MGDVKRWSVTYTKHIKQKRKVYQDGFIELHDSSKKILLYDDCEKLLYTRIVKKDDVRSGETLTFDSYLVDIGDLDGEHNTLHNENTQGSVKKISDKAALFHGQKFKHNSVPIDRTPTFGKNKAPSSKLSPSQNIIREYKKNEMNKYGAPRICPDTTKTSYCDIITAPSELVLWSFRVPKSELHLYETSSTKWNVLYTTQITQKAKKYHDGFLRVTTTGTQGRQVTLYDISRGPLDSRFLNMDEVIGSGESLAFDGHLVDIGDPEEGHKPLMDLKVQERNCTAGGKTGLSHGQQTPLNSSAENRNSGPKNTVSANCRKAVTTSPREWNALYTTQITQKAKKYHSGIVRLVPCGSYQMQAILLNEDGIILTRKYLKLSEDVITGSTFQLPNHLVEVGEPRTSAEGEPPKNACSENDLVSNFSGFGSDSSKLCRRVEKPLRDANGILSSLRKPMTQEPSVPIKSTSLEHCHSSESSKCVLLDLQNQMERDPMQNFISVKTEADIQDEETSKKHNRVALQDGITIKVVKSQNLENRGESEVKHVIPSSSSFGSGACGFSSPNSDANCPDKNTLRPIPSVDNPQDLDAHKLDHADGIQRPTALVTSEIANRNTEIDSLDLMSLRASSSCQGNPQPNEDIGKIPLRGYDGAFSCDIMESNGGSSDEPGDIVRQSSEVDKSKWKMDEIPSFDLGC